MNAKDFKNFLKVAKKHNKGNEIPVCDNLLFKDNMVIMHNVNADIQVTLFVNNKFKHPFLVELSKFDKIINKLGAAGVIDFNITEKEVQLYTNKGNFNFELAPNVDDFPERVKNFKHDTLLSEKETQIVKRLSAYVSKDELRPVMTNVLLDVNNIVATDSHLLLYPKTDQSRENKILINGDVARELLMDESHVSIYQKDRFDRYIRIFQPQHNIEVTFRETDGKYPSWEQVIPKELPNRMTMEGKQLLDVLDVGSINTGVRNLFIFETIESKVKITTRNEDFKCGFTTEIKSKNKGSGRIGLNYTLLSKAIKTEKLDTVVFRFDDPSRAGVINGYILIMPVKIDL